MASAALALWGFPVAFIADAASYLIGAAVVVPLPLRPAPEVQRPGWRCELSEGIALLARRRAVQLVLAVSAAVTFTSAAFLVVEPLYARHVLHRPRRSSPFRGGRRDRGDPDGLAVFRLRARLTGGKILMTSGVGYGLAACYSPVHRCWPPMPAPSAWGWPEPYRRGRAHHAPAGRTPCPRPAGSWASTPPFNPG